MIARRRPFAGATDYDLLQAIVDRPEAPLTGVAGVTDEIDRVVERALEKARSAGTRTPGRWSTPSRRACSPRVGERDRASAGAPVRNDGALAGAVVVVAAVARCGRGGRAARAGRETWRCRRSSGSLIATTMAKRFCWPSGGGPHSRRPRLERPLAAHHSPTSVGPTPSAPTCRFGPSAATARGIPSAGRRCQRPAASRCVLVAVRKGRSGADRGRSLDGLGGCCRVSRGGGASPPGDPPAWSPFRFRRQVCVSR